MKTNLSYNQKINHTHLDDQKGLEGREYLCNNHNNMYIYANE